MQVTVRVNGDLRRHLDAALRAQGDRFTVIADAGLTVRGLVEKLGVPWNEVGVTSVNRVLAAPERVLAVGDEVDLYAPIGGGSPAPAQA